MFDAKKISLIEKPPTITFKMPAKATNLITLLLL